VLKAPIPSNDEERLKELLDYKILDTEPETAFDELGELASMICQTPIALVSLVDRERQWFKSKKGISDKELPRETSFCGHAIHEKDIFIVRDSRKDLRFHNNPLVESGLVRFYAGVPLVTPHGHALGTLCIIDQKPRDISAEQIAALKTLARQVSRNLELHRSLMDLNDKYSEIKNLSRVVTQQKAELIEAAKFVAMGTLASGMAHEINNPLAVIHGIQRRISVMIEKGLDTEKLKDMNRTLDIMVQRITGITRGLLEYSRENGKEAVATVSVKDILDKSLGMCRQRLEQCQIQVQLPSRIEYNLTVRPLQIAQVMMHLINNAHDAILHADEKWIKIEVQDEEDKICLIVMDSGKGIPGEVAERIMEPFFTTKDVGEGTGLGLSIAKGIAESHHGKLYLDRTSPHTKFVLEIPKALPQASMEAG
jgi:two-component system NtrC family sensor kinase